MVALPRRIASFLSGVALSMAPGRCPATAPPRVDVGAANRDFVPLGVHPGAAEQPTRTGRIVATLFPWEGRLYAGYGDINANTGPIAVSPYHPDPGSFVQEWLADTEAIYIYRPIGGRLYAPAIDPKTRADFSAGRPWHDERPVDAYHVYDAATLTGTDVWLVGARELDAVAWRSLDGVHWEESLRIRTRSGSQDQLARFYFAGVYEGRLYLQAREQPGVPQPASRVFDGIGWHEGPSLLPEKDDQGWHPVVFSGRMVYQTRLPVVGESRLLAFDGRQVVTALTGRIWDFTVDGPRLFALGADGTVRKTADLESWTTIATAPPGCRSLGALDGWIYLGTTEAGLLRSRRRLY
jgi:hypothetical protein